VHAVGLDERGRRLHVVEHLLLEWRGRRRRDRGRGGGSRRRRAGRGLGKLRKLEAEAREDALEEPVLAAEQRLDSPEERPGLRALDDAVVVRGGHRHDLLAVGKAGGSPDGAGRDDAPLARHESRHRGDSPDPAGVRQRDARALEVVGREAAVPSLTDQVLVYLAVPPEVHLVGALDHRHDERPRPVVALDVDREAQVYLLGDDAVRLAVDLLERMCHRRVRLERAHDRPSDQVSEGHLEPAILER
jgi:hypothetical protein